MKTRQAPAYMLLVAMVAGLVSISLPAHAQTVIDIDIPETVVCNDDRQRGNPPINRCDVLIGEATTTVLAVREVPAVLFGASCSVVHENANGVSVHPNTNMLVVSGDSTVIAFDVERESGVSTRAEGVLVLGNQIIVLVELGPNGVFSGNGNTVITCNPPTDTTTTTTLPETTTTTEAITTTTLPTTTTTLPTTTTTTLPGSPDLSVDCSEDLVRLVSSSTGTFEVWIDGVRQDPAVVTEDMIGIPFEWDLLNGASSIRVVREGTTVIHTIEVDCPSDSTTTTSSTIPPVTTPSTLPFTGPPAEAAGIAMAAAALLLLGGGVLLAGRES